MAETTVKNRICMSCGVEARSGALYCFNCGNLVSPEEEPENDSTSSVWFRGDLVENKIQDEYVSNSSESLAEAEDSKESVDRKKSDNGQESIAEKQESNIKEQESSAEKKDSGEKSIGREKILEKGKAIGKNARMRSASALHKQARKFNMRKVEVVWEERESAPNLLFIIVSAVLILFALGVLLAAMYLQ